MVVPSDADPDAEFEEPELEPEPAPAPGPRPVQVSIASGLLFAVAAVWLLGAITYFWAATDEGVLRDNDISATTAMAFGLAFAAFGCVQAVAGVYVRRGSNPARIAAIVVCALGILLGLLGIIGLAVHAAIAYLLLGPRPSRDFFTRPAPAGP
jgi:hypothetical protein